MIGESIMIGAFLIGMLVIHGLVGYGYIVFIPSIFNRTMDGEGWFLFMMVLAITVLLIGFWCLVLEI